ncbi:MAG TPA: hypothetical protein VIG08_16995 [Gemmatimonadales bacterium]
MTRFRQSAPWRLLVLIGCSAACGSTEPGQTGSGGLSVVTTTIGIQPDTNGYIVLVDGVRYKAVGANDSVTVPGIPPGSHTVELFGIAFNCATLGEFARTVSVSAEADTPIDYSVACDAVSRSRIGFVRGGTVAIMNADGSEIRNLFDSLGAVFTEVTPFAAPFNWSGDGSRVAFTRADGALYATTADGTGVIQLAPSGTWPIWSEDGEEVAFLVDESAAHQKQCCYVNVFVARSDGSAVTRVTDLTDQDLLTRYDFSADGRTIAYDSGVTSSLFRIQPDGTGLQPIVPPGMCCLQFPSLSPDGTKVTYFAYPDGQTNAELGYDIFVSPVDGSGPTIDVSNSPGDDWRPVWSPDGSKIAFISSPPGEFFTPGNLVVVNPDGTDQKNLTPDDDVLEPAWSPDGARIAYTMEGRIFVANADGSGRRDLGLGQRPTWTGR